jgi:peptide methionine sulfoxide reductase msrA/msrB
MTWRRSLTIVFPFLLLASVAIALAFGGTGSPDASDAGRTAQADGTGDGAAPVAGEAVAYFAAGCFWCVEADFEKLPGVLDVRSGFMGGHVEDPTYEQVVRESTGHREVAEVRFDPEIIAYQDLLAAFWRMHDPTDAGGSFVDRGHSYTSAIYVVDDAQRAQAEASFVALATSGKFDEPLATEVADAGAFWLAEDYHQDYARLNPVRYGYYRDASGRDRFIEATWSEDDPILSGAMADPPAWFKGVPSDDELRASLDPLAYRVVREDATERAFSHPYDDFYEPGLYVDVISGEPLFSSTDKFDSGSGWPSFTKPIDDVHVVTRPDRSFFTVRTEARSRLSDAHLGHVFDDGPAPTGQRWCINGVALRFVPLADLEAEGYGAYLSLFEGTDAVR